MIPWTPTERLLTVLIYVAYVLCVVYSYRRIRGKHPDWEGRAEFASMLPGVGLLLLLSLLVVVSDV